MRDLVILVADIQQEKTVQTLLEKRRPSLGLAAVTFDLFRHPGRDAGVYRQAGAFLSTFIGQYRYALVLLDVAWDGSPGDAAEIERTIQTDLDRHGWQGQSAVIALDPELEIWLWTNSPHLSTELDMTWQQIVELAEQKGYWAPGAAKPMRPKELLEDVLYRNRRRRSSALFIRLAQRVGLTTCQDAAFVRLRHVLQSWFPAEGGPAHEETV
jgi:hypothetical protein